MMVRIKQNYNLITEKSLVGLAVSQYDADTVEFVQLSISVFVFVPYKEGPNTAYCAEPYHTSTVVGTPSTSACCCHKNHKSSIINDTAIHVVYSGWPM
jgi:hypothetical protein